MKSHNADLAVNRDNLKTKYLRAGLTLWGPTYWAVMNIFMFFMHQEPKKLHDLIIWLVCMFVGSECLGFLVGAAMWILAKHRR